MANWYDKYLDTAPTKQSGDTPPAGNWYDKYLDDYTPPKAATKTAPPVEEMGSFRSGLVGMTADSMTAGAKVLDVMGAPEWSKYVQEGAESRRKAVEEQYHPKVPSFSDIYKEDDLLGSVGRLGTYTKEKALESAPQMLAQGAAALGAAAAAPAAGPALLFGLGARGLAAAAGATAAGVPAFTGSHLEEQMKTGKSLRETSLPIAAGTGVVSSLLDTALAEVMPGVGKAVFGGALLRAAKKGLEGMGIEAGTEALQEAIEIGQADPRKLWDMPPEVQKRLLEAGFAGGLLGGGLGAAGGAMQKRRPDWQRNRWNLGPDALGGDTGRTPDSPGFGLPEGPPDPPIPPPTPPSSGEEFTGVPGAPRPMPGPDVLDGNMPETPQDFDPFIHAQPYVAPGNEAFAGGDRGDPPRTFQKVDLPIPYQDTASEEAGVAADQALSPSPGIPRDPRIPSRPWPATGPVPEGTQTQWAVGAHAPGSAVSAVEQAGQALDADPTLDANKATMAQRRAGDKVEADIKAKLLAVGRPANEAIAGAKIVRAFYQALGARLQADPFMLYESRNISVQGGPGGPRGGTTYNQDETPQGGIFSELTRQIRDIGASETGMKSGTGRQWLNLLQKRGLGPELAWSDLGSMLEHYADKTWTREALASHHRPYQLDVYETKPDPMQPGHYGAYTLGAEGGRPGANYREVVLSEPMSERGSGSNTPLFAHEHFPNVPNPVAHYRTIDRSTPTGDKVMLVEEIQSDWHQAGRKVGYRKSVADSEALQRKFEQSHGALKEALLRSGDLNANPTRQQVNSAISAASDFAADPAEGVDGDNPFSPETQAAAAAYMAAHRAWVESTNGVADAPFKETWPNMVFKYALMDAIRAGKDYIAWTTGEQQADRYHAGDPATQAARKHGMQVFYDKRVVDIANKLGKHYGTKVESIEMDRPNNRAAVKNLREILADPNLTLAGRLRFTRELEAVKPHTVHAMKITPAMRETLGHAGMSLEFRQNERAKIRLLADQTIIQLLKNADASSFMHETAHLFLEEFRKYAPHDKGIAADLNEIYQWLGVKDGKVTVEHHEKFAKGFERYLQTGKAPSTGLKAVFQQFAEWLGKIYGRATALGEAIPPNITKLFDRMLSQNESLAQNEKASSPKGAEFKPGRMPKLDRETFSQTFDQSALERMHRNATPMQLRGLAAASPDKAARFIVHKDGSMTAGAASQFTHDQLMYPDGNSPTDARQIEKDWYSNVAARGFVHALSDGRFVHDVSSPSVIEPEGGFHHPITQRLERAGILDPSMVQSHHSIANVAGDELTFNQSPVQNPVSVASLARRAVDFTKTLYGDTKSGRLMDPLGHLVGKNDYLKFRNAIAKAQTWAGRQEGAKALAEYQSYKLSDAQHEQVMRFLETPNADPALVPYAARARAVADKKWLYDYGQHLVNTGMLPQDTFDANAGAYVPRLYLKYLMENKGLTGAGLKPNASELKHRKNKSLEDRAALGEIRHPGLVMDIAMTRMTRDVGAFNLLNQIAGDERWSLGRSMTKWRGETVTPEWLVTEADAMEGPRAKALEDMGHKAKADEMRRQGSEMRQHALASKAALQAAVDALPEGETLTDRWKKLPDTPNYGRLRGAWVAKDIANDITGMADFVNEHSWAGRWLGDKQSKAVQFSQFWKMMKVPFNPASQVRNGVSNMIAANVFAGVPLHKVLPLVLRAAREMRSDGPIWQAAKRQGIPAGTMAENELYLLTDMLKKGLDNAENHSGPMGLMRAANIFSLWAKRMGSKASDVYGAMESVFKTAVMAHAMESKANGGLGMSEADAAILANEALFDYSLVHPSIRYLRNAPLGMPFVTYTYKMLPQLGRTLTNPKQALRLLPYAALAYALPAMVASMYDLEDGDIEKLRNTLAEGLRRQNNMYLMPFKDEHGRWQFVDIGYFFPWQVPQDMVQGALKGSPNDALKPLADMAFSHPVVNAITAMKTGIDPFTKRVIADKRDPLKQQATDIMAYIASQILPTALSNYGVLGKVLEKEGGTGLNRYGEPTADWAQIGARLAGVNIYPILPEAQRARNLIHLQSEIQQVRSRLTYELKDQSLTPDQRRRITEDYRDKIIDLTKDMQKYARESAMTPSLQRASRP